MKPTTLPPRRTSYPLYTGDPLFTIRWLYVYCRYRAILSHFHPDVQGPAACGTPPCVPRPVPILGFSATFSRHDGLALGSVFESIVYHRDFLEMIKEQWYVASFPYIGFVPDAL
jgi:hypothetical protein